MRSQSQGVVSSQFTGAVGAIAAGLCANLVGVGLARFAYTPLIPALVTEHWFVASQAAYLGAANLIGYLVGALISRRLTQYVRTTSLLRTMMLVVAASFFACGCQIPFFWFSVCRFAAGFAGAVLMVVGAPIVLQLVPPTRRGFAAGIIIAGVGGGIIVSGTLVPILLRWGLVETWFGLGLLSLLLTMLVWRQWPAEPAISAKVETTPHRPVQVGRVLLTTVYVGSMLTAIGLVPHYVFVVDFIARGLGYGIEVGSHFWLISGIGALAGPALIGHVGDQIGFKMAFRLSYLIQGTMMAILALTTNFALLVLSSIVIGAFIAGIVPLALGRIQEILPHDDEARKAAWRTSTTAFAIGQAIAGYGYSYIFSQTNGAYQLLFTLGAITFLIALCIDLAFGLGSRKALRGVKS